uniref:RNA-directed DNA polymerase, eukaryota, reverse transcriptase zinc-binding domain protein n=1 Tax=Tanacetum cinerariifolium TaxID=118510 RepID=A0A6L2NMZ8_TANCI|nr:RNA-directed DNA polymerase, eukaryota, reverse transcriptase zinc-binding domain protein [Tanacetum cinerariifolium]
MDSDIESTNNNDNVDYEDEENEGEDEDVDDDLFDDRIDGDLFCNELNNVFKYGGVSIQESCGSSKAPGPDGFTFKFIKHHWDTIGHNFIDMVKRFEIDGFMPKDCNPSFIALIPKVLDPLPINDFIPISLIGFQYKVIAKVISNRISKVAHSVVSEVDFEKAFDSLDWKFLDHTMEQMGFSPQLKKWIHGCLDSSFGSVFINGSPTKEFKIQKGICQGDPLLPFLYIIAMEALHVSIQDAKSKGIFEGVNVGSNGINISHLQFVDDALIMDLSFGGRLTLLKSVLGALGTYFFSLFKAPTSVIIQLERLRRHFFWGGSLDRNKLAWIAWKKVCSSNYGGLGIGSLYASNLAMLANWWWRSPWKVITVLNKHILKVSCDLNGNFSRKVGDGATVAFWNDVWIGNSNLKTAFPKIYSLEIDKDFLLADRYIFLLLMGRMLVSLRLGRGEGL